MSSLILKSKITSFLLVISATSILGQNTQGTNGTYGIDGQLKDIENGVRPVQAAVPFLNISPNARAAGLGDQGVATSPDEYSAYWNPAKLAMLKKDYGFGICYNPWLRKLVNDMSLSYLTGYYKLRKEDAIAVSLTYFDLGTINFTDNNGQPIVDFNPREFAFAGTYSRLLGKNFSGGLTLKYIYSNLSGNISNAAETQSKPGQSAAADIGFYYNRDAIIADRDFNLAFGIGISNIGGKISYSNNSRQDFLPTMLRLGTVITHELDDFNKFSFGIEASKLMVPSSVVNYTYRDSSGVQVKDKAYLATPNKSLFGGMLGSFSDAPFGAKEELQEIIISTSAEYWYDNLFAVRAGYFYENPHKGNRQYFTTGLGIRYQVFGLDFSYLIATSRSNPLSETLRFSLSFNFEKAGQKEKESVIE